jgi:UDP-N-acetylmuramoyl-tripeptide--D-alanyl-D-alanine ligase
MTFVLRFGQGATARRVPASIAALGRLSVHNALAAAAVGSAVGMTPEAIVVALAGGWPAQHRAELVPAGPFTIVDDSYNASPASMIAAIDLLAGLPGRHVAVLGEMLELGDASAVGHREVGLAAGGLDLLVTVGTDAAGIAAGAREAGLDATAIVETADRPSALAELRARLRPGDVVLVKASRGAELDRLVDELRPRPA